MRFEAILQEDGTETLPPKQDELAEAVRASAAVAAAAAAEPHPVPTTVPVPSAGPSVAASAAAATSSDIVPPPPRRRRIMMNLDRAVKRSHRSYICQAVSPLIFVKHVDNCFQ